MKRTRVNSSLVRTIGYDGASSTLEIEYTSGDVYLYFMVPESVFEQAMSSSSLGSFINDFVKDHYPFKRTRGPTRW